MTFFVQSFMFDNKKSDNGADQYLFPRDISFIPEFTIVDMHVMTYGSWPLFPRTLCR